MKIFKTFINRSGLDSFSYPIPVYANSWPYMLGGLVTFGFMILALTGIYLAQYYNPDPLKSYQSVVYIITRVPFGDFVRSLHYWTANLIFIILIAHIIRVFITGSYKKPRELTWYSGVLLLALTLFFVFSGSVLKWDQEGVEALGHSREVGEMFGPAGAWFTNGFSGSLPLLGRMFVLHINILVLALIALVVFHLFLIKQHGISPRLANSVPNGAVGRTYSQFSKHLTKLTGLGLLLLFTAGVLALIFPAPLGYPGVPDTEVTKPWWVFYPFVALENFFDVPGLVWGGVILFVFLILVPLIDRNPYLAPGRRKPIMVSGSLFLMALVALGIYAWLVPPKTHLKEAQINRQEMRQMASAEAVQLERRKPLDQMLAIYTLLVTSGSAGWLLAFGSRKLSAG